MTRSDITELAPIIDELGIHPDTLLGYGGESWVFALDQDHVARINRPGADPIQVAGRTKLLAELGRSAGRVPFAIPELLETMVIGTYLITIERRLRGRPLIDLLADRTGEARDVLVRAYLEAASQLGDLRLDRPWFGDLLHPDALRTATFRAYLEQRALRSLMAAGESFRRVDPASLAAALPEPGHASFVHLDAFPGNMLADGEVITAVLDFGASCIIGDRRLDPLTAAVYLAPSITPSATDHDRRVAREWLVERELNGLFDAAQAWSAAYWSFALDDASLARWCRELLLH